MAEWACQNTNCHSYGAPHPNCKCPAPMAEGGKAEHFCMSHKQHDPDCEYYAEGGDTNPYPENATPEQHDAWLAKAGKNREESHKKFMENHEKIMNAPKENPSLMLGHAVVSKGLAGLLKEAGKSSMQDPDKYHKVLQEAKDRHLVTDELVRSRMPRTMGGKLGYHLSNQDHEAAAASVMGHPLTGIIGKNNLKPIMERMSDSVLSRDTHPSAFRSSVDYLNHAGRGQGLLDQHITELLGNHKSESNLKARQDLKEYVDNATANPESMLDTGGDLGHYLPEHHAQLSAMTATAVNYLSSLKPKNTQLTPLDPVLPPDKTAEANYDRQLDIANKPLSILQHMKSGTLQPMDLTTMQTIYPTLHKQVVQKLGEELINLKAKDKNIPYKMRSSLSLILGQPLDSTMTQQSMQAIMQSAIPKNSPNRQQKQTKSISAVEAKTQEKANSMLETPSQARQINKKS